jgi:hypothetical protein
MTTITHSFSSARTPARGGAGFGVVALLVVLAFAMAGIWGGPRTQIDTGWQTTEASPLSGGFEESVPPELFPLTGYDFATSY